MVSELYHKLLRKATLFSINPSSVFFHIFYTPVECFFAPERKRKPLPGPIDVCNVCILYRVPYV